MRPHCRSQYAATCFSNRFLAFDALLPVGLTCSLMFDYFVNNGCRSNVLVTLRDLVLEGTTTTKTTTKKHITQKTTTSFCQKTPGRINPSRSVPSTRRVDSFPRQSFPAPWRGGQSRAFGVWKSGRLRRSDLIGEDLKKKWNTYDLKDLAIIL